MKNTIKLTVKHYFGSPKYYIEAEDKRVALATLKNRKDVENFKTLTEKDIEALKVLGLEFEAKNSTGEYKSL